MEAMRNRGSTGGGGGSDGGVPGVSVADGLDSLANAGAMSGGLGPEGYVRNTDPDTGYTGYIESGDSAPSPPSTFDSDRPPGYELGPN